MRPGFGAEDMGLSMRRRRRCKDLRQQYEAEGEKLVLYSARHGYAHRAHLICELPPKVAAAAMGHSAKTHLDAYSKWCGDDVVDDAFERPRHVLADKRPNCDLRRSGARKLEQAEAVDAITLDTLRRVADALDCDLQYALVPRRPLLEMRWQQALHLVRQWQQRAGRTMALEAQPVASPSATANERLEAMAMEILRTSGTRLWD